MNYTQISCNCSCRGESPLGTDSRCPRVGGPETDLPTCFSLPHISPPGPGGHPWGPAGQWAAPLGTGAQVASRVTAALTVLPTQPHLSLQSSRHPSPMQLRNLLHLGSVHLHCPGNSPNAQDPPSTAPREETRKGHERKPTALQS